jgi:hypothetical protein
VPPARLRWLSCRMLARLGWLASPVSVAILVGDRAWAQADGPLAALGSVRLEQWVALAQLGLHGWLLGQARQPEPVVPDEFSPPAVPAGPDRR